MNCHHEKTFTMWMSPAPPKHDFANYTYVLGTGRTRSPYHTPLENIQTLIYMTRILVSTTLSLAGQSLSDQATCHMPHATLINNRLRGRWRNLRHQKIHWAIDGPPRGLVPPEPNYYKAQLQAHRMTATASKTSPISLYPMLTDGGYALGSLSCPFLAVGSIKTAS